MDIQIDFKEIKQLEEKFKKLASLAEVDIVDRKFLTQCRDITQQRMKPKIPVASNHNKSGRKTKGQPRQVPRNGHAKENIPAKIRKNGGNLCAEVGWQVSDNEEYFYVKFLNWGTTRMEGTDFIDKTKSECEGSYLQYAEKEYQSFLDRYLR